MSNSPPTTLGQYQIIREIARSNDIVYEAYDPLVNRRVAVKELSMPSGMTDAQKVDRISRFKREAQAAGTLNHANIMTVYSFAEDAGRTFMAMEFLDGQTLRNEIDTKGFIAVDRAVEIATAILEGLGHAHSKGVIHRDIKPDNVQILSNGSVKITDFGIARLTFQPNLTMDGQVFGTPSYMSPEQVVGRDIDARSDLFSVAVVLYEMLSGQKPFPGDSVVSITYAIMNKEPQQPNQCDWALWQVLSRALDKSPQLRYASAADMIEALNGARKSAQSGTMAANPNPSGYNPQHPNNTPNAFTSPYANPSAGYSPLNPQMGQAMPPQPQMGQPQMGQPQVGQGGYSQQPYNPYQQPVAPPQYGFNPYNQPPGSGVTPYVPVPGMPPPSPLPIYYPPPPRRPILSADQVIFSKKIMVAFLILGTLIALVFVALNSLATLSQHEGSRAQDSVVAMKVKNLDPRRPLEERISEAEALQRQVNPADRPATNRAVADLYAQKASEAKNDSPGSAEHYLNMATTLDPTNATRQSELGTLLYNQAKSALRVEDRVDLLRQSAAALQQASQQTTNAEQRKSLGERSALTFIEAAQTQFDADKTQGRAIRDLLNRAREVAPTGSQVLSQIDKYAQAYRSAQN